jgi:uncharacterized protein YjdB
MKYCLLLILIFCFLSGYSQEQLHNLLTDNLRGKVTSVKTTKSQIYQNKNGVIKKILINKLLNEYDRKGNLLSLTDSILYDEIGTDKINYTYNDANKLIRMISRMGKLLTGTIPIMI